jgi:hypothetical protein
VCGSTINLLIAVLCMSGVFVCAGSCMRRNVESHTHTLSRTRTPTHRRRHSGAAYRLQLRWLRLGPHNDGYFRDFQCDWTKFTPGE